MNTPRKTNPNTDYWIGKTYGFNPSNPYGYFSLMGANHRKQELAAQKQKALEKLSAAGVAAERERLRRLELPIKPEKKPWWKR